jgi:hypothetical protein
MTSSTFESKGDVVPPALWTRSKRAKPYSLLGRGYNSVNGESHNTALDLQDSDFDSDEIVLSHGDVRKITTHYDLLESIGASASASAKFPGFGGSGLLNYTRTLNVRRDTFFIAVNWVMLKSFELIKSPKIKRSAVKRLSDRHIFLTAYGDRYCSKVVFGGQLWMTFQFFAETRVEQEALEFQVHGSYGTFTTSAELLSKTSLFQGTEMMEARAWISGAPVDIPISLDAANNLIKTFPKNVKDRAFVIETEVMRYDGVQGVPSDMRVPDLLGSKRKLDELGDAIKEVDTAIDHLENVEAYPFQYKISQKQLAEVPQKVKLPGLQKSAMATVNVQ